MLRAVTLLAAALLADVVIPDWDGIAPPARPTRLALHAGAIFLGTEAGLYRRAAGDARGWSLVAAAEPILDLASAGDELLIATPANLYACSGACDRPERIALGAGATPSALAVDARGDAWAATGSGLFLRRAGEREWRREQSLPAGAIDAVASTGAEVWVGANGALYSGGAGRGFAQRLAGLDAGWWQLCGAAAFGEVTLLGVASGVWRIDAAGARRIDLALGPIYRVERAGERVFVAAENGLYAYSLAALGSGGGRQALSLPALGLGSDASRLWVATERGLAAFALDAEPAGAPARAGPAARALDQGARIAELRRAVLEYQELAPERLAELERRARWAGLYPELRAAGSVDHGRDWDGDHNTAFSTGALHHLADVERDQKQAYGASVSLVWELSDLVTPDHALDVSRERRLVISLRDQVLERVNHLYFQRVQLLAQRDALAPGDAARRAELELAAAEIAAQLDAWSGGVFSRLEQSSPLENRREP
ncbi:MAG TPA: hypothetical protein VEI82_07890 [Myxococcota bacterium]|nr:hypothetical protein [Myxococcota bacterium]